MPSLSEFGFTKGAFISTGAAIEYRIYMARLPAFGSISRWEFRREHIPSPSLWRVVNGRVDQRSCILKSNEHSAPTYHRMLLNDKWKWIETTRTDFPMVEVFRKLIDGGTVRAAGSVIAIKVGQMIMPDDTTVPRGW